MLSEAKELPIIRTRTKLFAHMTNVGLYAGDLNIIELMIGRGIYNPVTGHKLMTEKECEDFAIRILIHELEHYHQAMFLDKKELDVVYSETANSLEHRTKITERLAFEISGEW